MLIPFSCMQKGIIILTADSSVVAGGTASTSSKDWLGYWLDTGIIWTVSSGWGNISPGQVIGSLVYS